MQLCDAFQINRNTFEYNIYKNQRYLKDLILTVLKLAINCSPTLAIPGVC